MGGVVSLGWRHDGYGAIAAAVELVPWFVPVAIRLDARFDGSLELCAAREELVIEGEELLLALAELDKRRPNEGGVIGCRP
jgi:hypothetical protein